MTVEYCLANVDAETRALLWNRGAVEHSCLDACGLCYRRPFLVIDSDIETDRSHAELLGGTK